jgi:3-hydroxybenzoate 6-monooxygenase
VPKALAAYDARRTRRAARVQMTARAMGALFHLDGVAAAVRNELMAARAGDDYAPLDWLYGYRL